MDLQQFKDAVVATLMRHAAVTQEEKQLLHTSDLQQLSNAIARITLRLAAAPRLIIELNPTGQDPTLTADREIEVAVLRHGMDLQDADEDDLFDVAAGQLPAGERAGWRDKPVVDGTWTAGCFAALDSQAESVRLRQRMEPYRDREYEIAWHEGYPPTDPQQHPLTWFSTTNGFGERDAEALIALDIGDTYVTGGPMDRVTITRQK